MRAALHLDRLLGVGDVGGGLSSAIKDALAPDESPPAYESLVVASALAAMVLR